MAPSPCRDYIGAKYVRFVGYSWGFYPGVGPYFFLHPAIYLPVKFEGISIKAGEDT
jgi:hypothetical protein